MSIHALAALDVAAYKAHPLHGPERVWAESNCYIDVWIEILHAAGLDPYACLGHVFSADVEADQITFFKPSHDDLFGLYGLVVHELNVWRPLLDAARAQVEAGRIVLTEVDAFFLPDTAGTDYRTQHTKTTIGIQEIDEDARRLGYFHNGGYHALGPEDFTAIFRLDRAPDATYMPFFAELVRLDRRRVLEPRALVRASLDTLASHLAKVPARNPVAALLARFGGDLAWMQEKGLPAYHAWAFASLRQLGAAFELAAHYGRWLGNHGEPGLEGGVAAFTAISDAAKALVLKTARAVYAKKPLDAAPLLEPAARAWDEGTRLFIARYGR